VLISVCKEPHKEVDLKMVTIFYLQSELFLSIFLLEHFMIFQGVLFSLCHSIKAVVAVASQITLLLATIFSQLSPSYRNSLVKHLLEPVLA